MMWHLVISALGSLRRRLLRSALIVVTVSIGIAAVLATVALTDGLTGHVSRITARVGRGVSAIHQDLFYLAEVFAGGAPSGLRATLTWGDLAAMTQELPTGFRTDRDGREVERPVEFAPAVIEYAYIDRGTRRPGRTTLVGTTPAYGTTLGYGLVAGRFLNERDLVAGRAVCVLDGGTARRVWGADVDVAGCPGQLLTVRHHGRELKLEVVGVLEEPYVLRQKFASFDTVRHARPAIFSRLNLLNLYVPITLLVQKPRSGGVTVGGVVLDPGAPASCLFCVFGDWPDDDILRYEDRVRAWAHKRGLAVFILPQWYWMRLVNDLIGEADVAGSVIWMVILGVTIIMILVINLVVVRERFREVAIRRTEGARRLDVVVQLMVESSLLSLVGGALGIALGTAGAWILSERVTGWPAEHSLGSFALAVGASLAIGVLSTSLPAWQVARLDPVKVLARR